MSVGTIINLKAVYRPRGTILGKFLSALVVGTVLGLLLTFVVLENGLGFGAIVAGPWTGWPRSGTPDVDPYTRAMLAYSGEVPLSVSEGLSFIARRDSEGSDLYSECDYTLQGRMPRARFWTLTLLSPSGLPVASKADRHGFTSSEILRGSDGAFQVALSRHARAGNWLPIGDTSKFILVLHLYDSELNGAMTALDAADMPQIVRGRCE
ncbi:hypothetical protein CU048_15815 [Beijerinckiaceae bacterium]|nr:hypothetical protein CU048_15815 [Beijerinckiaceae bacterium]